MSGLIVDLFAGGGGASVGIEAALGRPVDVAINHDAIALAVHKANHPATNHLTADIWEVRPLEATGGRPVELLWASPDCTHFSVAKGGKPRKQNIRSLAWAVVRWAAAVRPRIIALENVAEFRGWGPLGKDGRPDRKRMGETFRRWRRKLEALGYVVDYRVLDASHYGARTRRRRLFLVARRDGQSILWPEPTHGPGRLPYRTAAECIDWTLPCPSIFERERPLADKTMWRIAQGIKRFVMENPRPFLVEYHTERPGETARTGDTAEPLPTQTTENRFGLVVPSVVEMNANNAPHGADEPLGTVTTQGNRFNLVAPSIIKVNHGKDEARGEAIDEPLTTVTAKQRGHAVVVPSLMKFRGDSPGAALDRPAPTVTAGGKQRPERPATGNPIGLLAPTLIQTGYGERVGQAARALDLHTPLGTMVNGQKHALVSAFLATHYGGEVGIPADRPASTITSKDHHGLVAATLATFRGTDPSRPGSASVDEPLPVVSAGGVHVAEVRAFLTAYYGSDGTQGQGQQLLEPMRTLTTRHRLGLVLIEGTEYQIVDIGMRMLQPHELKAAQFGRFAAAYDLSAAKTKSAQVRLIGNSVCPEVAEALIRANTQDLDQENVA